MDEADFEQKIREIQSEYLGFLDDKDDQGTYTQAVKAMIGDNQRRLIVNINDLRKSKYSKRADKLLSYAFEEIIAFQRALKEFVPECLPTYDTKKYEEFFIGFEGSFGSRHVSPRTLTSRFLGNIVCLEGIVTKCSLVRPKIVRSVHYCPATQKTIERKYTDLTSYDAFPSSSLYPTKDEDGNLLETEYGLSIYKDHQTFSLQEMPEKSPPGQLPRSVDIIADNDLVDLCKPGERVQVIGIYRCLPGKQGSFTSGTFRTVLIANNISVLSKEIIPLITRDDVTTCKTFTKKNKNVFDVLAKGLAPSIHGHEYIKKALLCMLVGGVEKILPNGTRLRGDINILLIGDPSVAKSQLLRYVLHSAPRAIPTTGRGSSGVGLTAAVTSDHETGERRLEAGAMVLADRGVVCIDEFDKMSDIDRTAIHEVMEQGRVTIAKAGIHAQLNARCSVLAAANPVYGRYDQYRTPMENIGLQDSLLSRFDLLFIVLDIVDPEHDRKISDHVVRMHRYRNPREQDGEALSMGTSVDLLATKDPEKEEATSENKLTLYEKYDPLLHGSARSKREKIVSVQFLKKFVHVARILKPTLTRDAAECIAEEYSRLRSHESEHNDVARTQPVTPRTLETLIRLATAHAKIRLSQEISLEDAQTAIELVQFAYFKKVMEKSKKRRRVSGSDDDAEEEEEEEEDDLEEEVIQRPRKRVRQQKKRGDEDYDPYDIDGIDDASAEGTPRRPKATRRSEPTPATRSSSRSTQVRQVEDMDVDQEPAQDNNEVGTITDDRLGLFKAHLFKLIKIENAQSIPVNNLTSYLNTVQVDNPFTIPEVNAALRKMDEAYEIMVTEGIIFLI